MINITEDDVEAHSIVRLIHLSGMEVAGKQGINFNVCATNDNDDCIQIDGRIEPIGSNTVTVYYLLVDYYDEVGHSDYEYDEEGNPEVVEFEKLISI